MDPPRGLARVRPNASLREVRFPATLYRGLGLSMRILVIDDELVVRKAISTIFRLAGHECKEAANALAGIACAEQDTFDLVLLDMNMPGLHGLEALKAIAHMEPRAPVVVMSGASGGTDFQVLAL